MEGENLILHQRMFHLDFSQFLGGVKKAVLWLGPLHCFDYEPLFNL